VKTGRPSWVVRGRDGQRITVHAGGKLKKVAVTGGAVTTICDARAWRGGWWAADDTILFQPQNDTSEGLMRVPAGGGEPEVFLRAADERTIRRGRRARD
jgi:hypothetical protein